MSIYKMRTEFGHHLKWVMAILAGIFIIGAIFTFGSAPRSGGNNGQGASSDEVVATVSGMNITRGEVEATWARTADSLRDQGVRSTLQFASERARVFQQIVESRYTLAMAQEMGVQVNDRDVAAKRDQMIEDFLKDNRRRVLGKTSSEQDRTDPRSDSEYKAELAKGGMSIGQMEERAKSAIPEGQIQYQLAEEGLRKAMTDKAGKATDEEITNSYNVYGVRQIIIPKANMPAAQLKTKVDKIEAESRSGGDFVALAKQNTVDASKGAIQTVSYGMVSPEVWDQLLKLKAGEVSAPIDTDQAVYIVKVESLTPKLPAKFDKKTKEDRGKMISGMREMQAYMKIDKDVRQKISVGVTDPELNGYWHLAKLQQRSGPAVDFKKEISLAANSFKKAIAKDPNNQWATAMLAVLLKEQGNASEAQVQLYHLLEGENSKGEGADLRIMLGDMLLQSGKKADAEKQYEKAAEAAGPDVTSHKQLIAKFKQLGRADLAASEQKTVADLDARKKAYDAQQSKAGAPQRAPATP